MAATPKYKVFTADNEYVASFKHLEDAAQFVAFRGSGSTVRLGHSIKLWTEGSEEFSADESFDNAAEIMRRRERERHIAGLKKAGWSDDKIAALMTS